ncbi:hypothetical protein C7S18_12040 [Ahniella affigens]|uniref:DUF4350 domain-containing protein n=1 Tax=Ahniella affigens TaxID=2021234 RepID=A0A2P1PST5_9GAMM|nr:DUF4350 domain-containing protein [Ahniella affigens]AVP97882.1 hypothetical protein C7S18_12040 [Ahniella affigens]
MSRQFWVALVVVLVLGLGTFGFFSVFDRAIIERPIPPKPEVLRDRFRAAIRTLEHLDLDADRLGLLEALTGLNRPDVLIVGDDREEVSARARSRVQAFVEQGGVLILEAKWYAEDDSLADLFGVERRAIVSDESDESESSESDDDADDADGDPFEDGYSEDETVEDGADADSDVESEDSTAEDSTAEDSAAQDGTATEDGTTNDTEGEDADYDESEDADSDFDLDDYFDAADSSDRLKNRFFPDPNLRRIQWANVPEMLVHIPWQQHLSRFRTEAILADASGQYVLTFPVGKGEVVVLNSLSMFENFELARNDHAEFLWQLIHRHPDPKSVMFYIPERRDLADWVKKNAWAPMLALGILIGFWLWRAMPRFGPIAEDPVPVRRRLLEHLRASGNFLAAANQREEIGLAALRVALARVRREFPHIGIANEAETREFLIKQFSLTPDCAFQIASQQTPGTILEWTRLMRACRDVHAALDHQQIRKR